MERILIKNIRKYPCLWATTSEEYKMYHIKNAAWRDVIKECGLQDIKEAKNLWKKLRDGHRQSLNRRKTITGEADSRRRSWKYDKMMEFLLPYMANRPRTTDYASTSENQDLEESENSTADEIDTYEVDFNTIDPNLENNFESNTKKRKANDSITEDEKKTSDIRAAERDLLGRVSVTEQKQKDAMKSFFDTMYEMSKNLPEHAQMQIQREVFNSVMQVREENSRSKSTVYNVTQKPPLRLPFPTTSTPRPSSTSRHVSSHIKQSPQSPHSVFLLASSPPHTAISNSNENITDIKTYNEDSD
ncbi:uncharacterized protein LOC123873732 [Maniola jurtina]|uniref:uncharacterized protein LOC123873732 n=1 Tax=Maniola jurtina TaxID=191418 RepID=UPI001E68AF45|nr:uncharacterized protein LOC123873732 [Maniola jurtina]